ncbi:MAG: hypothetical protein LBQ60_11360 [Bacteroidales bacterium]|jgi:hypothetical protein|nr:hypothetical protein [Bacteroidales bacterium]
MKKLKKLNLDFLAEEATALTENQENMIVGGGSGISPFDTLWHYMTGSGSTYTLTGSQFSRLSETIGSIGNNNVTWVEINGTMYAKCNMSLYGTDYENSLGTCSVYFDQCGNMVGMKDFYDFNTSDINREWWDQMKTKIGSHIPGSEYHIGYGIHD